MNRRLIVTSAAALTKVCLLVLPLWDIARTVMGASKESVAPLASGTGILALVLVVYFSCTALVDLLWAAAAWLEKELIEEFHFNWQRVLAALGGLLIMTHPVRAWYYFKGLVGMNELTESAVLINAQLSCNHHLLVLAAAVLVCLALPPLRVLIQKRVLGWQVALAGVFLVGVFAWFLSGTGPWLRGQAISLVQAGNGKVFVGTQGWLFDRREINALTGPAERLPAASKCVLEFAQQLKERGVPLLLIPLPMKTAIYPEFITGSDPDESEAPIYHARQPEVYAEWAKAGIDVQDITAAMMQAKEKKMQVFFKQSSFWTTEAMEALARAITEHVRKNYPAAEANPLILNASARDGFSRGSLAEALWQSGPGGPLKAERSVLLGFPTLETDAKSPVALIGGSAVRVFDDSALGYAPPAAGAGEALKAGFAQQLSVYLGRTLDVVTANDGAATECRRQFARELDDQVRAKKLVIWLLPVADLLLPGARDWQPVTFNSEKSPPETLLPMVRP